MSALIRLAAASLWNRRYVAGLTVLTIAVSVMLFIGVERLRQDARDSFLRTAAGIDLIVGARSHPVQLLLYSVFRLGDATNNLGWDTYQTIAAQRGVAWTVPISLGDSHRGYRVVGTTPGYFEHVRYAGDASIEFSQGRAFEQLLDAVVGAEVAARLQYLPGSSIVLAHGTAAANPQQHDDRPFTVVGVLAPTGTPIDQGVYVSLEAIEAIHLNWRTGTRIGSGPDLQEIDLERLAPRSITAFYLGLSDRMAVFSLQRFVNEYRGEALSALMPGVALQQLWSLLGTAERALQITAACVVLAGLLGMLTVLLATLNERRREMAILRSVGAGPRHVMALLLLEALGLAMFGTALGLALLQFGLLLLSPWLQASYGILVAPSWPTLAEWKLLALVLGAALLVALIPAALAYRRSVADGMSVRN